MTDQAALITLESLRMLLANARGITHGARVHVELAPSVLERIDDALDWACAALESQPEPAPGSRLPAPGWDRTNACPVGAGSREPRSREPLYPADLTREEWLALLRDGDRRRTPAQIAEMLGCCAPTVRKYLKENGIPGYLELVQLAAWEWNGENNGNALASRSLNPPRAGGGPGGAGGGDGGPDSGRRL